MGFTLHEITSSEEFPAVVDCERAAYKTPFNAFDIIYTPQGLNPAATRDATIKIQWDSHTTNPASHWLKVVDSETGHIAGAALWYIFETDPLAGPDDHRMDAVWWPEGDQRKLINMLFEQFLGPREITMRRPCLLLQICFVHPDYRRRGVGNMLLEWGTKKADERNVEAFVEATDDGKPLYARHGFHFMNPIVMDAKVDEPSEQWKALGKQLCLPIVVYFMWRPIGGKFVEGETVIPWKK
ncbi:hypothetical protein MMC18_007473 [Xylographa bjoerkii]|nr:hypothetical protein [Xylographa bjoerkii]MCJ1394497.1 hypothetical protein [Xylographa bjoerkii]MCJ1394593.1 hypothetical protein [Xylographa bjoerkii]